MNENQLRRTDSNNAPRQVLRAQANIHIESLEIHNFRGIVSLTIDFEEDLTVLVGPNNVGKSRIMRAVDLACGGATVDRDDLSVGRSEDALITVVVAPVGGDEFSESETRLLGSGLQSTPAGDRFAWRTTLVSQGTGGVTSDSRVLTFDSSADRWAYQEISPRLTAEQSRLTRSLSISTSRDLADEIGRRGSQVRRLLDHLEFEPGVQDEIESKLRELTDVISGASPTLQSVRKALGRVETLSGSGSAQVNVLPSTAHDLARSASIGFGTPDHHLPMRFHGSGVRSLSSLELQRVAFELAPGEDASTLAPLPISLIEEPEAHLHPQAQQDLPVLLSSIPGQVIVSTHSSHLVTAVEPRVLRILKAIGSNISVRTLKLGETQSTRLNNQETYESEIEKVKRLVERPFGEILFASVIVIGDGATERAFLPPFIRSSLGYRSSNVCVIDPGSMSNATPIVKFANAIGIEWVLFADNDEAGQRDAAVHDPTKERTVFVGSQGQAFEAAMTAFDKTLTAAVCATLSIDRLSKDKSGATGRLLADQILQSGRADSAWPESVTSLISEIKKRMG